MAASKQSRLDGAADWTCTVAPELQGQLKVELQHTVALYSVVCCVRFCNDGRHLAAGCNQVA